MSEQSILAALSVDNVRAHVEHITKKIPSRLAGSENGRRMAEYSAASLRAVGVEAVVQDLPGLVSFPEKAEFKVLAPVEMTIEANTLGHSTLTPPNGVEGVLLDVFSGAFEEYEGKDARGTITLSELSYHPARHEKQRIAGLLGAAGCVMMNWGAPDNRAVPFGSVKPAWGNPTSDNVATEMPTLPCIGIARTDGLRLRELCRKGPVRVWLRTHVENGWRPIQITTGQIPVGASEDFVIVGGHQDSWFGEAATDNAAGNACILELARVFDQHKGLLRRGLVFGFWAGHETGTMVGSSWFVDRHWDRLRDHAAAYLQIDQPACVGTTRWGTRSNVELRGFHEVIERRLCPGREQVWRQATKIGDASFFGLGVPMMTGGGAFTEAELKATALANLGWWHHSLECTIDKVDFNWMSDHLRLYGAYLWELLTAPVLPFHYAGVAAPFVERLKELAPAGKAVGLDGALARAEQFHAAAARLDQAADRWRERYRKGGVKDDEPAEHLNRCMKRLGRLLIPLESTAIGTYGHDPYGLTSQTTMIPCLYDLPRLERLPQAEARWMLETKLVRQRNRVADALGDACLLIDGTVKQVGEAMRILYQLTSPMEKTVLGAAEVARRREFLRARAASGVDVEVWSLGDGPPSIESEYEAALVVPELTRSVPRAAREGFDAVIIGCVSDPGLGALRELVSIPVVGPGTSAVHLAAQLGNRFAILSPLEESRPRVERHVAALGFEARLAAVRGIGMSVLDVARDRETVLDRLAEIGRAVIRDDHADVLVLGCMSMGFLGITDDVQKRLEIPVVNPVVAALKTAEMIVALGLSHSRLAYPTPPKLA